MLGNPKVRLRIPERGHKARTVTSAPSVADVVGAPPEAFLDLPGDALRPRCRYARDFAALRDAGRAPPLTYAHIAREPGRQGLAVQYFFFYYFNQFNDLHEGDWEGMQIAFDDAETPAQALEQGPTRMVLFQHRGGEQADWDDPKVEKRGTHPVVYPAAGSHATFYGPAVYVGHGSDGSGVGCDNTTPPLHAVRPKPVLLPDDPQPGDPMAWLLFNGHWGELHGGISGDGPTGPMLKNQWYEPFTWMEAQRRTSPVLPATSLAGPDVTHAFCGAVAEVSEFINLKTRSKAAAWAILALILIALVVAVRLTRWRPVAAGELRHRRALGQLLAAAGSLYARHFRPMVTIGLAALPLLVLLEAVDWLGRRVLGDENPPAPGSGGALLPLSDPLLTYARPLVFALVAAAVVAYVRELDRTGDPRTMAAVRLTVARCWRVVACHLLRSVDHRPARAERDRAADRRAQVRRLAVHPAGDLLRGRVDPRRLPAQHGGGARALVAHRPGHRHLLPRQHRRRAGTERRADLRQPLATGHQPDRLDPVRGDRAVHHARPDAVVPGSRDASGRGAGASALGMAAALPNLHPARMSTRGS